MLHFESDILKLKRDPFLGDIDLKLYSACLKRRRESFTNYISDKNGRELEDGREVPVTCRVHKKVLLNLEKGDIDEKEEDDN